MDNFEDISLPWPSDSKQKLSDVSNQSDAASDGQEMELAHVPRGQRPPRSDSGYDSLDCFQFLDVNIPSPPIPIPSPPVHGYVPAHHALCHSPPRWDVPPVYFFASTHHSFPISESPDLMSCYRSPKSAQNEERYTCDRRLPRASTPCGKIFWRLADLKSHHKHIHDKEATPKGKLKQILQAHLHNLYGGRNEHEVGAHKRIDAVEIEELEPNEMKAKMDHTPPIESVHGDMPPSQEVDDDLAQGIPHQSDNTYLPTMMMAVNETSSDADYRSYSCSQVLDLRPLDDALESDRGDVQSSAVLEAFSPEVSDAESICLPLRQKRINATRMPQRTQTLQSDVESTHKAPPKSAKRALFEVTSCEGEASEDISKAVKARKSNNTTAEVTQMVVERQQVATGTASLQSMRATPTESEHTNQIPKKSLLNDKSQDAESGGPSEHESDTKIPGHDMLVDTPAEDGEIKIARRHGLDAQDVLLSRDAACAEFGSFEASSCMTDHEDDTWTLLSGWSTYSQTLNNADDETRTRMNKAALMAKFLDEVLDDTEQMIRDSCTNSALSDADGAESSKDSHAGSSALGSCLNPTQSHSNTSGSSGSSKHKLPDDDDNDDEDEQPPLKDRKITTSDEPIPKLLSCPFHKRTRSITTRHSCEVGYDSIARLREHLLRAHKRPIYCIRCNGVFEDQAMLIAHVKDKDRCNETGTNTPEGLSSEQQLELTRARKGRRQDPKTMWTMFYRIIFPTDKVIPDPWYDATVQEAAAISKFQQKLEPELIEALERGVHAYDEATFATTSPELLETVKRYTLQALKKAGERHKLDIEQRQAELHSNKRPHTSTSVQPVPDVAQYESSLQVPASTKTRSYPSSAASQRAPFSSAGIGPGGLAPAVRRDVHASLIPECNVPTFGPQVDHSIVVIQQAPTPPLRRNISVASMGSLISGMNQGDEDYGGQSTVQTSGLQDFTNDYSLSIYHEDGLSLTQPQDFEQQTGFLSSQTPDLFFEELPFNMAVNQQQRMAAETEYQVSHLHHDGASGVQDTHSVMPNLQGLPWSGLNQRGQRQAPS